MSWSKQIRQGHRWFSMFFVATVIITTVVVGVGAETSWVVYLPLLPLFLLLCSGLYMFVLPYRTKK
ncbi:hypothetical protein LWC34_24465 [Kibdelosporangium philippinense]|uniref:Uncharacterized protein n=1 Tax=Kibdelosporangium philippinense TaxID=211113 RepID=A0ABS8ZDV3_9PSEU|nr:hypothetical protein [Kibdelosporangium philippinense]MCE7005960.1 hypothetical protein [Kibdelosporangium philippinense]